MIFPEIVDVVADRPAGKGDWHVSATVASGIWPLRRARRVAFRGRGMTWHRQATGALVLSSALVNELHRVWVMAEHGPRWKSRQAPAERCD